MTTVFWIQRGDFTTNFVDTQDRLRYVVEWSTSEGRWSSSVRTVAQQRADTGDSPDFWYDEIANITWRPEATYITLGTHMVSASSYLRRKKPFSSSRVFKAPGDQILCWNVKGRSLILHHQESSALIARYLPSRLGFGLLSRKPRLASLEIHPQYSEEPQLMNAIVITWCILDGMMRNKDITCSS